MTFEFSISQEHTPGTYSSLTHDTTGALELKAVKGILFQLVFLMKFFLEGLTVHLRVLMVRLNVFNEMKGLASACFWLQPWLMYMEPVTP